jgi:histidinol-phosphate/aromatic aminotransferase/cobyric acid decarboxylase-like protein
MIGKKIIHRDRYQNPDYNNNLFSSFYLNNKIDSLKKQFSFKKRFNYSKNIDYYNFLSSFFQIDKNYITYDWSSDYIIKDLLRFLRYKYNKKSIFFEKPNYRMIDVYSDLYQIKFKDLNKAEIIYLTYPNINTPFSQFKTAKDFKKIKSMIKKYKNKLFIIDLAYFNNIFNYSEFFKINKLLNKNVFLIYSFTKLTGNANIRQGILISIKENIQIFEQYQSPHRVNQFLKFILMNLDKKDYQLHKKELIFRRNLLIKKLNPDFINGFNLFFEKNIGKYIPDIKLYRFSI